MKVVVEIKAPKHLSTSCCLDVFTYSRIAYRVVSLVPAITSTSARLNSKFLRLLFLQYDSAKWEPSKWEPSWNLPQFSSEKWELTYLGPGGLDSVSCPLKLGLSLGQDSSLMSGNCDF
jgi:hypothetical protein